MSLSDKSIFILILVITRTYYIYIITADTLKSQRTKKVTCISATAGAIQRAEGAGPKAGCYLQPAGRETALGGEGGL